MLSQRTQNRCSKCGGPVPGLEGAAPTKAHLCAKCNGKAEARSQVVTLSYRREVPWFPNTQARRQARTRKTNRSVSPQGGTDFSLLRNFDKH